MKKLLMSVLFAFWALPALGQTPHVVSTSPAQNELNVLISTNISVTFDIPMDETTINDSTFVVNAWSTGLHQGTITYDSPTKTATLDPSEDFAAGEIVTVVLTTDIQSSLGFPLDSSCVWSFTTVVNIGSDSLQDSIPFAPAVNYGVGNTPVPVFCADLDGDGDLDLAVANLDGGNVSILKNNGDGTFQTKVDYEVGAYPFSVFCADLDGDIDLDLVVANRDSDSVSILKNNGDGTFQPKVDYAAGDGPYSVFCADLDGDGDLDLAVANLDLDTADTATVSILKNNGDGTFQAAVNYGVGRQATSVFCADLDGDFDLDLAVSISGGGGGIYVLKNNGDGTFQSAVNSGGWGMFIFCADLNGDMDVDLAGTASGDNKVIILKNNGDGTFQDAVKYEVGDFPWGVFCADLDGDTDLDLAVANAGSNNVSILKNNGDGTFQTKVDYGTGDGTLSVFCADLDGDGDLDLAVAVAGSDSVSILKNLTHTPPPELVANFSAQPSYGSVPLEVQFTDSSEGNPTSWQWDFGDGDTDTLQNPTHTYDDTGYFDVKLVVSNPQDTDSLTKEDYIYVLPSIPVLSWADRLGYITDGVSPDTGLEGTIFTFRVVYSDAYNLPPQSGYPKVNIDLNGDGDFEDENEGSFTMGVVDVDSNYIDGREYLYNATLPVSSNCQYSFSAKNSYGLDAVGEPTNLTQGPVILDPAGELDLYIHASDITFSNQNPDEGETFTVYATIHNNSDSNLTNVSVTFYHSEELLDQVLLSSVPSHGSATASTELSFDTKGFYPIRVVVDEENSFEEWNELNNFAMRPVIVGDYVFPGGIVVQAQLNSPVYPHSWITVTGNAHYTPEELGAVSGASVTITIQETGVEYTTHTNDPGNFSKGFYGPSETGSYSVIVEVTDYTLTDSTVLNLDVLPPQSGVDLTIRVNLPQTDCLLENQEYPVEAEIFNLGDQDAQNFWTCIYVDGSLHHSYWVDQLPAGGSLQIDTTISFSSIGWHTVTGIVDVGDSVRRI